METMEHNNCTTHDECGLKAGSILCLLEIFDTLVGLKLGYIIFGASESLLKMLQAKDILSLTAVNSCKSFYT